MPEEKNRSTEAEGSQEPWGFEGSRSRVLRMGIELTPAEQLRWLEETVEEMLPFVGRARGDRWTAAKKTCSYDVINELGNRIPDPSLQMLGMVLLR